LLRGPRTETVEPSVIDWWIKDDPPRPRASCWTAMCQVLDICGSPQSEYCRTIPLGKTTSMCAPGLQAGSGSPAGSVSPSEITRSAIGFRMLTTSSRSAIWPTNAGSFPAHKPGPPRRTCGNGIGLILINSMWIINGAEWVLVGYRHASAGAKQKCPGSLTTGRPEPGGR
jgi:hypothetical protein